MQHLMQLRKFIFYLSIVESFLVNNTKIELAIHKWYVLETKSHIKKKFLWFPNMYLCFFLLQKNVCKLFAAEIKKMNFPLADKLVEMFKPVFI